MPYSAQKLFQLAVAVLMPMWLCAQEKWPSPELRQMYENANEYSSRGNYKDAITTYRQAIALAPQINEIQQGLGVAYYRSGDAGRAEQTLQPLMNKGVCDTTCIGALAASQTALQETKRAQETLKKGIEKFGNSGQLYDELGSIYYADSNREEALTTWEKGMEKDAGYAANYQDAARLCFALGKTFDGLVYGETYLAMRQDTAGSQEMKNLLFAQWKVLFDELPAGREQGKKRSEHNDELAQAATPILLQLTPVVSDGITTENLTMVRARFVMDWFAAYRDKYRCALFTYLNELMANGHFDLYNEWLFGEAENHEQYKAWNTFHERDMERFETWRAGHLLKP